jgi:ribosomal protein L37E
VADLRIIKNSRRTECKRCGHVHEYISRGSQHAECGTPLAMPLDKARNVAEMMAHGPEDIERIPTDTVIVLFSDEDRLLPQHPEVDLRILARRERFA